MPPRLPRKPSAPRPHGAVGAMAASLARRKAARQPRVALADRAGQWRTLSSSDPATAPLLDAAERLISAAQSGSEV
jgi:hypothetical protein